MLGIHAHHCFGAWAKEAHTVKRGFRGISMTNKQCVCSYISIQFHRSIQIELKAFVAAKTIHLILLLIAKKNPVYTEQYTIQENEG
jgi:hypothetical protein